MPPAGSPWSAIDENTSWMYKIWAYAGYRDDAYNCSRNCLRAHSKSMNTFQCHVTRLSAGVGTPTGAPANVNRTSYGINTTPIDRWVWSTPINTRAVKRPSEASLVNESSFYLGDYDGYWTTWAATESMGLLPHEMCMNSLYFDLHVKPLPLFQISKNASDSFWTGK